MVEPRNVTTSMKKNDPYIEWNEYIDLLAMSSYDELDSIQRVAHLIFWYESEVQNGGHMQYFENQGIEYVNETIESLRKVNAIIYTNILNDAYKQFASTKRIRINTVEEYVDGALENEFDRFDNSFHETSETLTSYLEDYLSKNKASFINYT